MRGVGIWLAAVCLSLSFAISAKAQGPAGAGSASGSHGGYNPSFEPEDERWQLAIGYQYNRDNLLGSPFDTHGLNVSAARYFWSWLGVEAQVGAGFLGNTGNTSNPPNLDAKSVFLGVGPRVIYRNRTRWEPWLHALVGLQHYRFSQTTGVLGNNNALAGPIGAGLDVHIHPHTAVRAEADFLESSFFSTNQRSFQIVGGIVFNY